MADEPHGRPLIALLAAVVGTAGGCLVASPLMLLSTLELGDRPTLEAAANLVGIAIFSTLFAVPTAVFVGLPVHTILRWLKLSDLKIYLATAACAGFVISILFGLSGSPGLAPYILGVALAATTFAWLIRRPDRDAPNPPTSAL